MAATSATSTDTSDAEENSAQAPILDAALVQFERVGVKKTTIEDIARIAGVDRVTVYRRIGSRDDVVTAVFDREVERVLTELAAIGQRHDNLDDLVADVFVTVIRRWRTNPLVKSLLLLEPERILPKLTTDGASAFTLSVSLTTTMLGNAVTAGLLPDLPDLPTRAEILCRIVHSFVLMPDGTIPLGTEADLDEFARHYLVPIIRP